MVDCRLTGDRRHSAVVQHARAAIQAAAATSIYLVHDGLCLGRVHLEEPAPAGGAQRQGGGQAKGPPLQQHASTGTAHNLVECSHSNLEWLDNCISTFK